MHNEFVVAIDDIARIYHQISSKEAELLLLTDGFNGSFILRNSSSVVGAYTLSLRVGSKITHFKCKNLDLQSNQNVKNLSVYDHVMNLLEQKYLQTTDGRTLQLGTPMYSKMPNIRYYHGVLPKLQSENLILEYGMTGAYLLRTCKDNPGELIISYSNEGKVNHVAIVMENGKYKLDPNDYDFDDIDQLIVHYQKNPLLHYNNLKLHLYNPVLFTSFHVNKISEYYTWLENVNEQNVSGFQNEYKVLEKDTFVNTQFGFAAGTNAENKTKNRYRNILPYDHSRVIVHNNEIKNNLNQTIASDYINANYININNLNKLKERNILFKNYIASQGCLRATVVNFWSMIFEQECKLILMITQEVESLRIKCYRYWPDVGKQMVYQTTDYGKMAIETISCAAFDHSTVRRIKIDVSLPKASSFVVTQLQYTSWPDHGVPVDPESFLNFLSFANELYHKDESIVLVHCSAGIGRTGTFIACDVILKILNSSVPNSIIDIFNIVKDIRKFRRGLVQTDSQYKFIYTVIKHYQNT
ncbi:hypothetical protein A3Q56_04729, partial [Intoshia linei]